MTTATDDARRQTDQVAKAMAEQARAARDTTQASQNIARQIAAISRTNREHSASGRGYR